MIGAIHINNNKIYVYIYNLIKINRSFIKLFTKKKKSSPLFSFRNSHLHSFSLNDFIITNKSKLKICKYTTVRSDRPILDSGDLWFFSKSTAPSYTRSSGPTTPRGKPRIMSFASSRLQAWWGVTTWHVGSTIFGADP